MQDFHNTVIYQINLPSFFDSDGDGIGDIPGVEKRLSYVASLGVTDISLSMLLERSDLEEVYATTDFTKPDGRFGTIEDVASLIGAAHETGLRVILPLPIRAVSPYHPWFTKASSVGSLNEYNLYKDYFIWKPSKTPAPTEDTKYILHEALGEWYLATKSGLPLLNLDNPRVRRELTEAISSWRSLSVDAFALLGTDLSVRKAAKGVEETVYKISEEIFETGKAQYKLLRDIRERGVLGEDCLLYLADTAADRYTIPYLIGEPPIADIVENTAAISDNEYDKKEKFNLTAFFERALYPHSEKIRDRICNVIEDAAHERLLPILLLSDPKLHVPATKALALFFFTLPGMHLIYQGQEIGTSDRIGKKAERALPMQWDSRTNGGFTSAQFPWKMLHPSYSRINVVGQENDPDSILNFYKRMILFRKEHPILSVGAVKTFFGDNKKVCAFLRTDGDEKLFIVCSFSEKEINYAPPAEMLGEDYICVMSNYSVVSRSPHKTIGLRPYEARIYALNGRDKIKLLN